MSIKRRICRFSSLLFLCCIALVLAGCGTAERLWLDAPDWSRAVLLGNTQAAETVPMAVDDSGTTYVFLVNGPEGALSPEVVAVDAQAEVVWRRRYESVTVLRPKSPRIFIEGERLRLFWIADDQLNMMQISQSGEMLGPPDVISGDVTVESFDATRDEVGQWFVWMAGPRREPGLYRLPAGSLTGSAPERIDPMGVRPVLEYYDGTLHALWAHYPTGYEEKALFYANYPNGIFEPDVEQVVGEPMVAPSSVLEGPYLGFDMERVYVFWTILVRTGLEAGSVETRYVSFPYGALNEASPPEQLFAPPNYDLTYERAIQGPLQAGERAAWDATRGTAFITDLDPTDMVTDELAVAMSTKIPYLRRKEQVQVAVAYFQNGAPNGYQLLSFTSSSSEHPGILNNDGYLIVSWLERSDLPGFAVYMAQTTPAFVDSLRGITPDDASRLLANMTFDLLSGALLLPFALAWIVVPTIVLFVTSFLREEDAPLQSSGVLISLGLAILAYWASKIAFLPSMRDYVPFSAWIPFLPTWLEIPLQILVPVFIAAGALYIAWRYTFRVQRRSPFFFLLIYATVDGIATMAVYGVLVFGAF